MAAFYLLIGISRMCFGYLSDFVKNPSLIVFLGTIITSIGYLLSLFKSIKVFAAVLVYTGIVCTLAGIQKWVFVISYS